jgi:outer membrane murein-binding lipoprotein Lpp
MSTKPDLSDLKDRLRIDEEQTDWKLRAERAEAQLARTIEQKHQAQAEARNLKSMRTSIDAMLEEESMRNALAMFALREYCKSGAENYVLFPYTTIDGEAFTVTFQRDEGLQPHEKVAAVEQRVEELEEMLEQEVARQVHPESGSLGDWYLRATKAKARVEELEADVADLEGQVEELEAAVGLGLPTLHHCEMRNMERRAEKAEARVEELEGQVEDMEQDAQKWKKNAAENAALASSRSAEIERLKELRPPPGHEAVMLPREHVERWADWPLSGNEDIDPLVLGCHKALEADDE